LELPEVVASLIVEGRHTAGLAAMLPLVLEAARTSELLTKAGELKRTKAVLGLPAYAADIYTRVGRSAIAEFSKLIKERHPRFFGDISGVRNLPRLIGMAIFHVEGCKLDRWVENSALADYRDQIEAKELQTLGWPKLESRRRLYQILESERELLWEVRRAHMHAAFGVNGSGKQ